MKPNEWGDFTAGSFSTLAFIWLTVAVVLQSTELREQRSELQLTRKEFEHSRGVMKAQALEAKRQAEYIQKQTEILQRQDDEQTRRALESEFDRLAAEIEQHIRDTLVDKAVLRLDMRTTGESFPLSINSLELGGSRPVGALISALRRWHTDTRVTSGNAYLSTDRAASYHLNIVLNICLRLGAIEAELPQTRSASYARLQISALVDELQTAIELPVPG